MTLCLFAKKGTSVRVDATSSSRIGCASGQRYCGLICECDEDVASTLGGDCEWTARFWLIFECDGDVASTLSNIVVVELFASGPSVGWRMDSIFEYFDPGADFERYDGNLPHWRQSNVLYFVTFRLGDSIPESKLNLWKTERALWLRINPEPHSPEQRKAYLRQFVDPIERWLDAGYGSCILKFPETKKIVEESLVFARGKKYALDEYVIMPNHVHVLVAPNEDVELEDVLKSWKSYTSHEINKLL